MNPEPGEAEVRVPQANAVSTKNVLFPLAINDRVQVTLIGGGEECDAASYLSRVEDISGSQINLGWPTSSGIRTALRQNDRLKVFFIKDAVYLMECTVLSWTLLPFPMVLVQSQAPVRKAQRREYVRVSARMDVRLAARVVKLERHGQRDPVSRMETRTFSISGAGFAVRYGAAPAVGNLYDVKLSFPECREPISANARVVRCEPILDPKNQTTFCIGFAFTRIKEADRRKIVSFVFRTQQHSLVSEIEIGPLSANRD